MEKLKLYEGVKREYKKILESDPDITDREIVKYKKEISIAETHIAKYEENCSNAGRDPDSRNATIEKYLAENIDYKYRFLGHANAEDGFQKGIPHVTEMLLNKINCNV